MKEKIVDTALIVTLIIVAFGITWTLLTLNRGSSRPEPRDPPAQTQGNGASSNDGLTITPLPIEGNDGEGDPLTPADPTAETGAQTETGTPPETQAQVPDVEPVPPGAVELERIGFSFVTGGAGACGIVLEPWRHVAVSRELLAAYGCGAEITIELDEEKGGRSEFQAVVADTMNPVHSRTVNIYVGEDEPALQYGVTSGTVIP